MARERKSKGPGRGGPRPGAGRPRELPGPGGIPWTKVRQFARLGADRDTIVRALGILPERLRDPDVLARMQTELDRGHALHEIDLLQDVRRVRKGGPGKVNAVLAALRHTLDWNKPDAGKGRTDERPDQDAAIAEIQRMLGRFRVPG